MRDASRPVVAAVVAATGLALSGCGGGDGGAVTVTELTVSGAWARPTPAGAANGVVYFSIASPVDDAVTGVSVPADIAAGASLHESTTGSGGDGHAGHLAVGGGDADIAGMREQGRIDLPAGDTVTLEPGGLHVMLTDLPDPLEEGERFPLTLALDSAGEVTTEVVVAVNAP